MSTRGVHANDTARTATTRVAAEHIESGAALCLHVVSSDLVATHPLPASGSLVLGRAADADVRIEHASVSRKHARLTVGHEVSIEDLGGRNGVTIAGARIAGPTVLEQGSVVQLGEVMLVLQRSASRPRARRLLSHGYFEARVEDECARADASLGHFAVMRVHVPGRRAEIDAAVVSVLRASDVLASYGPDELEVLLIERTTDQAAAIARRVVEVLEARGAPARAGYACFPGDGRCADALLARAGQANQPASSSKAQAASPILGSGLRALEGLLGRVARANVNVLITGETGVGKEIVATMLHDASPRAGKPFVRLNCAGFMEALLASELFGHERGAFTGADRAKEGQLEAADAGTVLLDEVGELPASIQPRLLRVLEDKEVVRVGALRGRRVDVRFIAATNRQLEAEVAAGRFRSDLYFRLNGFQVHVPPLRERRGDIEEMARAFAASAARQAALPAPEIDGDVLDALRAYDWPGNVRELRNVMDRAVLLCAGGPVRLEHLPLDKMRAPLTMTSDDPLQRAFEDRERQRIVDSLATCGGNQTRAARQLGIARSTLIAKMDSFGLPRPLKRG
jgi:two-component system response regulator AtoC